ncbi:ComF family protein [Chitinophaga sancti]|uniref:ComF family protein n=1 Tax=Chitinophaga sancti TaxID=1004 RepID=A0A1K1RGZ3_9BACT|nr:ComF family protein [Chitinophaga sancti]WQD60577.1 ComF family protein [Chitinophaga sancti]WQG87295.1 ComF family protein [Chitinophaga sancti]SFW71209.1 comF family protein [Chitinophaga sancti]
MLTALLHLCFPHVCESCGTTLTPTEAFLCHQCMIQLPRTGFQHYTENPVEKLFYGRVPVQHAIAAYYFSQASMLRKLVHKIKYRHKRKLSIYMGKQIGKILAQTSWIHEITCIVPVPITKKREKFRGYNQSALLSAGIAAITGKPVFAHALKRTSFTSSQTRKGRVLRWQNVQHAFKLEQPELLKGEHVLLIDDVITTGATTEACGKLFQQANIPFSICSLAYAHH